MDSNFPNGAASHKDAIYSSTTRPVALAVVPDAIPAELRERPAWVVWSFIKSIKKRSAANTKLWDKPPVNPRSRGPGDVSDPSTWTAFDTAIHRARTGKYDGIGFVFTAADPFTGIDLDDCRDPVTGAVAEWATDIIAAITSYTEVSPSGTGVKIVIRAKLSGANDTEGRHRFDAYGVEIYDRGRYFTVTGVRVDGTPQTIEPRQAQVDELLASLVVRQEADKADAAAASSTGGGGHGAGLTTVAPHIAATASSVGEISDADIIAIAGRAKDGDKFRELWGGGLAGHASASEADMALCSILAFYTGPDPTRLAALFATSGLYRDKWDRDDYRNATVARALEGRTEFYKPPGAARPARPRKPPPSVGDPLPRPLGDADDTPEPQLTDMGNAVRFITDHGPAVLHCHPWDKWLSWDGRRWKSDEAGEMMTRAKNTIDRFHARVVDQFERVRSEQMDAAEKKAELARLGEMIGHAKKSQHAGALTRMLFLSQCERPVLPDRLDVDHWLLNCPNGTIDLRTGELRSHRQADCITRLCPTRFDPDATCPRFVAALTSIFDHDEELIEYVRSYLGYSLTGDVREQILPVWYGAGSNGKDTLLTVVLNTLGFDYAGPVPTELLMETRFDQHPTLLADLFGRRLMIAAETKEGGRFNESRIKMLTGGNKIKARRMREDFWQFDPTHKLILVTNHRPEIRGTDHAIWRRLRLVPFRVQFLDPAAPENANREMPKAIRVDRGLPAALDAEREGILAWMVNGCLTWQERGLQTPTTIAAATADYRTEQDRIGQFIDECCVRGSVGDYSCKAGDLYSRYVKWTEESGFHAVNHNRFGASICERGIEKFKNSGNFYRGIAIKPDETADDFSARI